MSGTSLPMARTGQEVPRCAYPGCENEPRPGEAGAAAEPKYCGLPDPVTGEPHTALTAFRRRQLLARQGGGAAGPEDLGRPGFAFWRRAGAQRRQRAEAEAGEARLAVLQADARLAEALAAKAAAEQEAVAAREAARAWVADVQRAADERVAAAQQERDEAVAGAESRAGQAESRAAAAGQDAARAREAAGSARAELDRARQDAGRQVAQVRGDAAWDQAGLREALEARIVAAAEARDGFQVRAEHAEADAGQARQAVLQAEARLAEALAAKPAAEQEAAAAQARAAQAEREAEERVATAQQERDEAVAGAESRAGQAEPRAREVTGSARAELDRARQDAGRQVAQVREDAARDQAGLREALEARIVAAAEARDGFQARAEHAEAELQRVRADRDQAAGQATPGQPGDATRRRRRSGGR